MSELTYLYSSFKVIKQTLSSLSFDYIPYDAKDVILINFDRDLVEQVERELLKFKLFLPTKIQ